MKLSAKDISSLLNKAELEVEDKYRGKIKGDEYFKRGMMLGCLEMKRVIFDKLNKLAITMEDEC